MDDDNFPEDGNEVATKAKADPAELSPWDIIKTVMTSSRGLAAMSLTSLFGLVTGALEPTLVTLCFGTCKGLIGQVDAETANGVGQRCRFCRPGVPSVHFKLRSCVI